MLNNYQVISMKQEMERSKIMRAYQSSQEMRPLLENTTHHSLLPLVYQDSASPYPNYPVCAVGILTAKGEWGIKKGLAFVVEDNYLITCVSNCYSQKHGLCPDISFIIKSSRKLTTDIHKIKYVTIPQQYKILPKAKRRNHNYALLYIEGQPCLKDRYGHIKINFKISKRTISSLECVISHRQQLQLCKWDPIFKDHPQILNGGPLLFGNEAIGLIFKEQQQQRIFQLRFYKEQFSKMVQVPIKNFQLQQMTSDQMNLSCLEDLQVKSIEHVSIRNCVFDGSLFERLPVLKILSLHLINYGRNKAPKQISNHLTFLRLDKFKDIRLLSIVDHKIEPAGCQIIASCAFVDIRYLNLGNNPIGSEGCRYLAQANWPFLSYMILTKCKIFNQGVGFFLNRKRLNLSKINLNDNLIDNDVQSVLTNADLPLIEGIDLGSNKLASGLGLIFLKSPSWNRLKRLNLSFNRLGNKGCKMIKQAGFKLRQLQLIYCEIDSVGFKWLCKANLSKLNHLDLYGNKLRDEGCLDLSRASMPYLNGIYLMNNRFSLKGIKSLLKAGWANKEFHPHSSDFKRLVKSFGRWELFNWLKK